MVRMRFVVIAVLAFLLSFADTILAEETVQEAQYDEEHIVDVSKLKDSTIESLRSIEERLEEVQLSERFDRVFTVLEYEEIDNQDLKEALEDLEQGIDAFRNDWDTTIEPLWKGQEMVGETIFKVRSILTASQASKEEMPAVQKETEAYDARLADLSREIMDEPDPKRKVRLKLLFKNLYNLKQIKSARANLSPASQIVLARMVESLEHLEVQFTRIIYAAEESYAVLGNQQEFLKSYIQVVKGLIDIEDLAAWFAAGGTAESVATVDGLIKQFEGLNDSITDFEKALGGYSGKMIANIEQHSQKIEENLKFTEEENFIGRDLDAIIEQYAGEEELR